MTIEQIIRQNGLTYNGLSSTIKKQINYYESLLTEIEETKKELSEEEDEDVRKEIREAILEAESLSSTILNGIRESIEEFVAEQRVHEKRQKEQARARAEGQPKPKPQPTPKVDNKPNAITDKAVPQKKSMLGWFIGGTVLLLTLGAVNVLNKK